MFGGERVGKHVSVIKMRANIPHMITNLIFGLIAKTFQEYGDSISDKIINATTKIV